MNLNSYRQNHLAGILKKFIKIKDVLINDFPKIVFEKEILLHQVLLKMTQYKIGCCFFVNNKNELIGLLTDGDIRRLLLNNENKKFIILNDINQNYFYVTDKNEFIYNIKEKYSYIPVLENNKLNVIFRN